MPGRRPSHHHDRHAEALHARWPRDMAQEPSTAAAKARLALALLVAKADGVNDPAETKLILERLGDGLKGVPTAELEAAAGEALERVRTDGLPAALDAIALDLPTEMVRFKALRLAVDVAIADG